jgi:ketosteroid isomerase-like protein
MISQQQMALMAQAAGAFERRDVEAFIAVCDPDIEFTDFLMEADGGGTFHGHAGVRRWWDNYFTVFGDVSQEIDEVRRLDERKVLVHGRTRGRVYRDGMKGDTPFEQAFWLVADAPNDKAISWRSFRTEAEALEAAGPLE